MKKHNWLKIISLIFVCTMMIGAIAVTAWAADSETPVKIAKKNIVFGEMLKLKFAITAPDDVKVKATCDGEEIGITYVGKETIQGVEYHIYETVNGWSEQNINAVVRVTATSGDKMDVLDYSVLMYLYERLYLDDLDPVKEADRIAMYEALLTYAKLADKVINSAENGRTPNNFDEYYYVNVVGATLDGYNCWGMFKKGETPFENIEASVVAGDGEIVAWTYQEGNSKPKTATIDQIKALTINGEVTVTATVVSTDAPDEPEEEIKYSEGLEFTSNGDGTCYVSGIGTCAETDIIIPSKYNGKPVTSIGDYAFNRCTGLTDIVIPDSVTSIGDRAFWDCTSLTSIVIPDSVTSIGGFAFIGCTGLTDVYITDIDAWCNISFRSSDSNPMHYGANLYLDGNLVTELIIPEGVTSIGDYAFEGCTSLTSIMIPDSVTSIGDYAFYGCTGLTSIVIPDSVTSIGHVAFIGCTGLTSITVDEDNTSYQSIDGNLYSKNGRTLIQYAIGKKNTSFTIPDRVKSIGEWAFRDCTGLTSIVIPDSVTSIGYGTFYSCTGLTSIVIPDSVTSIGSSAFSHCTGLTSIVIPDSVTSIGGWYAFSGCTGLTSIVIPDSVANIGFGAFYNCTGLTSIVIHDSVRSIGNRAFEGCINLKDVYYAGIKQKWEKIRIDDDNECLTNATIHYNYVPAK